VKSISGGYEKTLARARYDVIYLLDEQGWYCGGPSPAWSEQ
jgi:hypothetical protein